MNGKPSLLTQLRLRTWLRLAEVIDAFDVYVLGHRWYPFCRFAHWMFTLALDAFERETQKNPPPA